MNMNMYSFPYIYSNIIVMSIITYGKIIKMQMYYGKNNSKVKIQDNQRICIPNMEDRRKLNKLY